MDMHPPITVRGREGRAGAADVGWGGLEVSPHWSAGVTLGPSGRFRNDFPRSLSNNQVKSRSGHSHAHMGTGTVLYIRTLFSLLSSAWLGSDLGQQPSRPCPQVPCQTES